MSAEQARDRLAAAAGATECEWRERLDDQGKTFTFCWQHSRMWPCIAGPVAELLAAGDAAVAALAEVRALRDVYRALGNETYQLVADDLTRAIDGTGDGGESRGCPSGHGHRWINEFIPDPMSAGSVIQSGAEYCTWCGATRAGGAT